MTEAMEKLSPSERRFAAAEIDQALSKWNLPCSSPARADLESRVQVVGVRDYGTRVTNDNGQVVTLDVRLAELQRDPHFSDYFPPPLPRVQRNNTGKLRDNFEKIARGEVVVE